MIAIKRNISQPDAIAIIRGGMEAPQLNGEVTFIRYRDCVKVCVNITGLPYSDSGFFGFHIHDGANCVGKGFENTGSHYNPAGKSHPKHSGDLPPLIKCNGGAFMTVTTDRFHINEIIGKTVVIHSMPDDFITQPAGNAGTKIGCGVIKQI